MTERDRLIELLNKTFDEQYKKRMLLTPQHTADYLIANGVIVPPCKVGQTVYVIEPCTCYNKYSEYDNCHRRRTKATKWIEMVRVPKKHFKKCLKLYERPFKIEYFNKLGKTVFLAKEEEEAEQALRKEDEGKMKTVKDITYSLKDIEEKGYGVENNIIKEIDVNIIAHIGNIPCLTLMCENIVPYGCYNDIARLGFLLKAIVEFFGVDREDGVMLSKLKNIPCRLVFTGNGESHFGEKAVGIGHYMKDKFILFEDFQKLVDHPTEKGGVSDD